MPNMHLLRQIIETHLADTPADLIVLPEVFNGMPSDYDVNAGRAAKQFLATLAKACGVAVIGGSIDYIHDDGRRRNTCFVVDCHGHDVGNYYKRVLFGAERYACTPGEGPGIFDINGLRVGVLICGDLWEPRHARELVGRVDVLCIPTKTTVPHESYTDYARRLWWNLALTRAMENGLPIVVSDWAESRQEATVLADGSKVRNVHFTSGGTSVSDPGRRPEFDQLQQTLWRGAAGLLSVTIDLDSIARFRDYRRSVGLLSATQEPQS